MAPVAIKNPATLVHVLNHHAKGLQPMVGVLSLGILTELLPLGWRLVQHKSGPNSYALHGPKGHQYHFRGFGGTQINVIDSWVNGKTVYLLRTRVDALRFIRGRVVES